MQVHTHEHVDAIQIEQYFRVSHQFPPVTSFRHLSYTHYMYINARAIMFEGEYTIILVVMHT
jgi:hypothetical protein